MGEPHRRDWLWLWTESLAPTARPADGRRVYGPHQLLSSEPDHGPPFREFRFATEKDEENTFGLFDLAMAAVAFRGLVRTRPADTA